MLPGKISPQKYKSFFHSVFLSATPSNCCKDTLKGSSHACAVAWSDSKGGWQQRTPPGLQRMQEKSLGKKPTWNCCCFQWKRSHWQRPSECPAGAVTDSSQHPAATPSAAQSLGVPLSHILASFLSPMFLLKPEPEDCQNHWFPLVCVRLEQKSLSTTDSPFSMSLIGA